jgi:opacity protein-like surface antigen
MNKTAKVLVALVITCAFTTSVLKANIFDDFKNTLQEQYMKPFARDIGGLIGGADFHTGKTAGFPGFDIALYGNVQTEPEPDNEILKQADVDVFGAPMLVATVGLPYNFEVVARGAGYAGVTMIGGGLRWGIIQGKSLLPDVKIGGFYDVLDHDVLKMQHLSASISASFDWPMITPYVGIGVDQTKLETKVASVAGVTVNPGAEVTVTEPRVTVGANLNILPLIYVFGGYSWMHGASAFQGGAGIKF